MKTTKTATKQTATKQASKWAPIKRAGEIVGHIEVFWGGSAVGYVTIPGASRYVASVGGAK